MPPEPFVLGINYWPRRKAMYWWSGFETPEVQDEFETIKGLGFGLVRIFLLWEDWQPSPDRSLIAYARLHPSPWTVVHRERLRSYKR